MQRRLSENKALRNSGRGTHSWLSGLIKCGFCGYAVSVVSGQHNGKRYLYCGGRKHHVCCGGKRGITFDEIENAVSAALLEHAKGLSYHSTDRSAAEETGLNSLKARKIKLEEEISGIVESFSQAENALLRTRLNEKMAALERQLSGLNADIQRYSAKPNQENAADRILPLLEDWEDLSLSDRKAIAKLLIARVTVWDKSSPVEVSFVV